MAVISMSVLGHQIENEKDKEGFAIEVIDGATSQEIRLYETVKTLNSWTETEDEIVGILKNDIHIHSCHTSNFWI